MSGPMRVDLNVALTREAGVLPTLYKSKVEAGNGEAGWDRSI